MEASQREMDLGKLPSWQRTETVQADMIVGVTRTQIVGREMELGEPRFELVLASGAKVEVKDGWVGIQQPKQGDFFVIQPDGSEIVATPKAFEGWARVPEPLTGGTNAKPTKAKKAKTAHPQRSTGKRKMSAAGRAAIAKAAKRRWARYRAEQKAGK